MAVSSIREREKTGEQEGLDMTVMLFLVKKFSGEKGNVRLCCDAPASFCQQSLGGKVFTHHIITVKHHSSMRN
jgi:hypothetical protein